MKFKLRHRCTAILMLASIIISLIIPSNVKADTRLRMELLGTEWGLNSPLLQNNVTVEGFKKWELETFAIFLSNFCVPFVDSMESAFIPSADYGSKGAGLDALQFACGGDIASSGILKNMLTYVLNEARSTSTRLMVEPRLYKLGSDITTTATSAPPVREAFLSDLLIFNVGAVSGLDDSTLDQIDAKSLPFTTSGVNTTNSATEFNWVAERVIEMKADGTRPASPDYDMDDGMIESDKPLSVVPMLACLARLTVGGSQNTTAAQAITTGQVNSAMGSGETVFDLADGWDCQILGACLNYATTSVSQCLDADAYALDLLSRADSVPLCIDRLGNIVATDGEKTIVVIPACLNKNITADGRVNLVNSVIMNNICRASDTTIAAAVSNGANICNGGDSVAKGIGGLGLTLDSAGMLEGYGNLLLYNTSDTLRSKNIGDYGAFDVNNSRKILEQPAVNLNKDLMLSVVNGGAQKAYDDNTKWYFKQCSLQGIKVDDSASGDEIMKAVYDRIGENKTAAIDSANSDEIPDGVQVTGDVAYGTARRIETIISTGVWANYVGNSLSNVNIDFYNKSKSEGGSSQVVSTTIPVYVGANIPAVSTEFFSLGELVESLFVGALAAAAGAVTIAAGASATSALAASFGTAAAGSSAFGPIGWIVAGACGLVALGITIFSNLNEASNSLWFNKVALHLTNLSTNAGKEFVFSSVNTKQTNLSSVKLSRSTASTFLELGKIIAFDGDKHNSFASALVASGKVAGVTPNNTSSAVQAIYDKLTTTKMSAKVDLDDISSIDDLDGCADATLTNLTTTIDIVCQADSALVEARNYLSLSQGTDFASLTPAMYITYLQVYGLMGDEDADKVYKKTLFESIGCDITNDAFDPRDILGDSAMTDEERAAQERNYRYLALTPSQDGVDYRNQIQLQGRKQWIASKYHEACYGTDITEVYTKGYQSTGSGFLHIDSYETNFATKWIVGNWAKVIIIMALISLILIIIAGLLNGNSFWWYISKILGTVILLIMLPTTGEMTPYICEKVTNSIFDGNSRYWEISEAVEEHYLAEQVAQGQMSSEALSLINMMQISQTNKTLMIKHDISRKVTPAIQSIDEIMELQSTRWLLGALINQLSADEREHLEDYVYSYLADTKNRAVDVYLYYEYNNASVDAKLGKTPYKTGVDLDKNTLTTENNSDWTQYDRIRARNVQKLDGIWFGWTDVTKNKTNIVLPANMQTQSGGAKGAVTDGARTIYDWQSSTYLKDFRDKSTHFVFGYLADLRYRCNGNVGTSITRIIKPKDINGKVVSYTTEGFDAYMERICTVSNELANGTRKEPPCEGENPERWQMFTKNLVEGMKDFQDNGDIRQSYGYLYLTEDVLPYMYTVIKDTINYSMDADGTVRDFTKSDTLSKGNLVNILLGDIDEEHDTYRKSFMHVEVEDADGVPQYVTKDYLDLEYLFTNYIPYIYQVMILTGGTGDNDGMLQGKLLGDKDLGNYSLYKDTHADWLYQSNWVTKLVTANEYAGGDTVYDKDGNGFWVEHTLFPQNYPPTRPMVFSEAQMYEMGLTESDLSAVELACVATNRDVCTKWTTLVNYVNTPGVTRETLVQQMAVDAMMIFNKNIQSDRLVSSSVAMYPTSVDLRSVNFDSVMKLIMLSDNYNSVSLKQDAVYTAMDEGGTFAGVLMMILAVLAVNVAPFVLSISLAAVFYTSMAACILNIVTDEKQKAKTIGGAGITNGLLAFSTILYYLSYKLFITREGTEIIIKTEDINAGTSMITWKLLALVILTLIYLFVLVFTAFKCASNAADMGMAVYNSVFKKMGTRAKNAANKIASKFGSKKAKEEVNKAAGKSAGDAAKKASENFGDGGGTSTQVKIKDGTRIKIDSQKESPVYTQNVNEDASVFRVSKSDADAYVRGKQSASIDISVAVDSKSNDSGRKETK